LGVGQETAERFGEVAAIVGGVIGVVVSLVLTVRAFMVGGVGYGLTWLLLADPIVLTLSYWATILIALPVTLATHARTKDPHPYS
jgi:hypothetical protein